MTEHLFRRPVELIWLGMQMTPFFLAEMLIHSVVKSTRVFFVILLKTRSSPFFPPSLLNWSPQKKLRSVFCPFHREQTLPINFYVGGLRCFKSRKPEDRLGCHKLWKIACVASIGHWAERSAQERSPFLPNTKPKLISIEMVGSFFVQSILIKNWNIHANSY